MFVQHDALEGLVSESNPIVIHTFHPKIVNVVKPQINHMNHLHELCWLGFNAAPNKKKLYHNSYKMYNDISIWIYVYVYSIYYSVMPLIKSNITHLSPESLTSPSGISEWKETTVSKAKDDTFVCQLNHQHSLRLNLQVFKMNARDLAFPVTNKKKYVHQNKQKSTTNI